MKNEQIKEILSQIEKAIIQINEWNKNTDDFHKLEMSYDGMEKIAATCMMLQTIGEGVKKILKNDGEKLLSACPDIPWKQVMGMRDRISHGYFDIDIDYVADIVKNDLKPLSNAVCYLKNKINENISKETAITRKKTPHRKRGLSI